MHPTGAGFVVRRGRALCGMCAAVDRHRSAGRQGLVLWGLFAATAAAWWLDAPAVPSDFLNSMSLFYVVAAAMTAIHESGHAVAAILLGVRVRGVQLGADGPPVISIVRDRFSFRLLLLPLGGKTFVVPGTKAARSRHVVIAAAGPLTELSLLLVAWRWNPASDFLMNLREDVLIVGVLSMIFNLVIPLKRHGNDSWAIVELIRMGGAEVDAFAGIEAHDRLVRRLNAHVNGEPMSDEELEEGLEVLRERFSHPGLDERGRAVAASNVASLDLLLDSSDALTEADEMSSLAYEWLPIAAVTATRGAVLVALGRYKEGMALLDRSLPGLDEDNTDSTLASLALAALCTGNVFAARQHLEAISGAPNTPAYRKAKRLIGAAELENVLRWYWTPGRSPEEAAAALGADGGGHSRLIADNIARYSDAAADAEIAALLARCGYGQSDPAVAAHDLRRLVDALRAAEPQPYRR